MKKLTSWILTTFFLLSLIPAQLKAETDKSALSTGITKTDDLSETKTLVTIKASEAADVITTAAADIASAARYNAQVTRLEEIRAMDMSTLTPAEKKELREEVHAIQNDQDDHDRFRGRDRNDRHHGDMEGRRHGGVFLSVGGGLLIVLLLILLL